ncbi:MAG: cytochrome c3 family protein [Anaerolineae bacterium]|nr:cytochrome c3 family protein [Anaerolineae bacterium]
MNRRKQAIVTCSVLGVMGVVLALFGILLSVGTSVVIAQDEPPSNDDSFCVVCHTSTTQETYTLEDGTSVSVAVDLEVLAASVHGTSNPDGALACADCHGENKFPHDDPPAAGIREYRINQSNACISCHEEQSQNLADDVHYTALADGNLRAATCVDCHGAHNITPPDEPRSKISTTCGTCHKIIFDQYESSVHGEALFEGDPNVPTCIDCHGVHSIQHPTTALFRNRSPELCATCHADEDMMRQYDISTNVFDSYLTDFHGETVALFAQQDPNVASNKAVCYDCHGVHDIARADAENSHVIRENLLDTCQGCHPGATADFPASWVGHFPPTLESHPFLFVVNTFYQILLPVVLGGFAFLVLTDIYRRIRNARKQG